jgi:Catalytic LigB subunit of aromatic ring-opening dioxygenase
MAKIILGLGTSHSPQLTLKPEQWALRRKADQHNPELWFNGKPYSFDQLVDIRAENHFERELGDEIFKARHTACQRSLDELGETFARYSPDVAVIFGDDQHEAFQDDNLPAISVYWGDTVDTAPPVQGAEDPEPGIMDAIRGHTQDHRVSHPVQSDLGQHIIKSLIRDEFDVAHSRSLPAGAYQNHSIGHAFGYVYRRIMRDEVIPHVPVLLNTYYPPNQPTINRCYELGKAVRRAIDSWDSDQTVAVIASGGLTHFVIEEDLDHQVIGALKGKDQKALASLPVERFESGTSEIRNWVAAAGVLDAGDLGMELVNYVPCYRSEAGTGCAMAFARWT